jgi:hypothetical protein
MGADDARLQSRFARVLEKVNTWPSVTDPVLLQPLRLVNLHVLRNRIDRGAVVVLDRQADRTPDPPARIVGKPLSLARTGGSTDRFEALKTFIRCAVVACSKASERSSERHSLVHHRSPENVNTNNGDKGKHCAGQQRNHHGEQRGLADAAEIGL